MQNDFIEGSLGTAEAVGIVDAVVERIECSEGELILFTQDTHQDNYLHTAEGKKLPVVHCIQNTEGWQINERVKAAWEKNKKTIYVPELHDNTFLKPVFGCVALVNYLANRAFEISEIEILGLCTDICVVSNAIMIKNAMPDINITVNASCCAGVSIQSHREALNVMRMCQIDVI